MPLFDYKPWLNVQGSLEKRGQFSTQSYRTHSLCWHFKLLKMINPMNYFRRLLLILCWVSSAKVDEDFSIKAWLRSEAVFDSDLDICQQPRFAQVQSKKPVSLSLCLSLSLSLSLTQTRTFAGSLVLIKYSLKSRDL